MNTTVAMSLLESMHGQELKLIHSKGNEYRLSDDQLDNFRRCARELGCEPLQAAGVFLEKHMSSIKNYIRNPEGELSEPIYSRILDARNYLFLISALIHEGAENSDPDTGLEHTEKLATERITHYTEGVPTVQNIVCRTVEKGASFSSSPQADQVTCEICKQWIATNKVHEQEYE